MNNQTQFIYDKVIKDIRVKSILNIGYRWDSDPTIMNYAITNNKTWSVLEVFEQNVEDMRKQNIHVYCLNVLEIDNIRENFDAIIWLHGPEHIVWDQFLNVRGKIEQKSNYITIYQAPIGEYPQDEMYGNIYEKHITTLYPEMFSSLGYETLNHEPYGEKTFSAWKYNNVSLQNINKIPDPKSA